MRPRESSLERVTRRRGAVAWRRARLRWPSRSALARAAAGLSRLAGAGGGTTLPGKLLWKLDPGAVDRLAARLPQGSALVSATNGKTTTAAMVARDPRAVGAARAQPRRREPRLRRRLRAPRGPGRGARAVRGGRGGAARGGAARLGRARSARQPVPRPARPLRRARAGRASAGARWRASCPRRRALVANGDDPQLGDSPRSGRARSSSASTTRARPPDAPARGRLEVLRALRHAVRLRGRLRRPPRRLPLPGLRPRAAAARRRRARDRAARARERLVRARHAGGRRRASSCGCRGSTTSTTRSPPRRSRARSAPRSTRSPRGSRAFPPRSAVSSGSQLGDRRCSLLLIKNPAGANEVVRTLVAGGAPRLLLVALNDEIADGRDVSWIWDVDFEPLLGAPGARSSRPASAPPSSRCASSTRACPRARSRSCPSLEAALDRGLELTPPGGELVALPTYTAMLALRELVAERGFVRPYWEERGVKIVVGHLFPDYLNIYADRGNIAVLTRRAAWRGHELEVRPRRRRRRGPARRARPLLRRRRPGPRAGADRARRSPRMGRRCARRSSAERRRSPSAAATSCSAASTATRAATSCRAPASCRCTRSRASGG